MGDRIIDKTTRMALAAYLHDLGKMSERARINEAHKKNEEGNSNRDINVQLYCPHYNHKPSHIHAAYTAMGIDILEEDLPDLIGTSVKPFAEWKNQKADDSLINAAAMHHKPKTFLQWVIATADRVASGFEREEFEQYNQDDTEYKENHYTTRLLTLFEQITLTGEQQKTNSDLKKRYPLKYLTVNSIFPQYQSKIQPANNKYAQNEYNELWQGLQKGVKDIPTSHKQNLPLWLDHFDSLWQAYAQAIPSATVNSFNVNIKPDVSLYDHSKTTAALAASLWRYHHEHNQENGKLDDWDTEKFLLIQGDFFGIQNFIFSEGGQTRKMAAKLLRGRSFYVSLLMECAALKLLDAIGLPSTSQIINTAGKFVIVAPNTEETTNKLVTIQNELNEWFLQQTYAQSSIGLAWIKASCNDFTHNKFDSLVQRLYKQLDKNKYQKFDLCDQKNSGVFSKFLHQFSNEKGVCQIDGKLPAATEYKNLKLSQLAYDQIKVGEYLTKYDRILITNQNIEHNTLELDLFGYYISFTKPEDITGKFGSLAKKGTLLRAYDFSLPKSADSILWNGYARREINSYVPQYKESDLRDDNFKRYRSPDGTEEVEGLKKLDNIADEDRIFENNTWYGISALTTLKGDVDNLGMIFQKGIGSHSSFAKMASLSRQLNMFFSTWLPYKSQKEFPNTYTVFAGGDDFFLIGPWRSMIYLANEMKSAFSNYVGNNNEITFSAGLSSTKPGLPIHQISAFAEDALDEAKSYQSKKDKKIKNAVTCFHRTITWETFSELMESVDVFEELREVTGLSTSYIYSLFDLIEKAENEHIAENAIWHSRFCYRTYRFLEKCKKSGQAIRGEQFQSLLQQIFSTVQTNGIAKYKGEFRLPLYVHLYSNRR